MRVSLEILNRYVGFSYGSTSSPTSALKIYETYLLVPVEKSVSVYIWFSTRKCNVSKTAKDFVTGLDPDFPNHDLLRNFHP